MATITTNTFLDNETRTAGEAWTMNGGVLTIRTDTRWDANAPAGMTGVLGATTVSATLGGGVLIDSRNVRWMPFDSGTGNVPAIGTNITQTGVTSSYLLGVYADYTSAPSSVGSAMPTTGYLKFREVDGAFEVGALTGIGASATAPDRQGWIEVVQTEGAVNTVPRLGFYRTRGGWFELDQVTSGSANDVIQIPTNGGGADTYVQGLSIETGVGTNEYEYYTAIIGTFFNTTNLGTDGRNKFVFMSNNGQVIIGSDGTNNIGFVPPAGCRIRIPSNILRQAVSADWSKNILTNLVLASRARYTVSSAGLIDFQYVMTDWYHAFASALRVTLKDCIFVDAMACSNLAAPLSIDNICFGLRRGLNSALALTANIEGGVVKNSKFFRGTGGIAVQVSSSTDVTIENCEWGALNYDRASSSAPVIFQSAQSIGTKILNCYQYNGGTEFLTSFRCEVKGLDHTDRYFGETNTLNAINLVNIRDFSNDILVENITFGHNNTYPDNHPYNTAIRCVVSSNILVRNIGTLDNPLPVTNNPPAYGVIDAGTCTNITFKRVYIERVRTGAIVSTNSSLNVIAENVCSIGGSILVRGTNAIAKGVKGNTYSTSAAESVYGVHTNDMFTDDTSGIIWWSMNEPTDKTAPFVTLNLVNEEQGGFTSANQVAMFNVGDELNIETLYFIKGHTSFNNLISPVFTGTGPANFKYEYDIDTGNGFSGTYKPFISIKRRASGGTINTNTITFFDEAPMPEVGNTVLSILGTNFPPNTVVTDVTGNTVTLNNNILVSIGSNTLIYFIGDILSYSLDPAKGFKLRLKITTTNPATTNAITFLAINTNSTLDAQRNLYPLETKTAELTISELETGTHLVLFNEDFSEELDRVVIDGDYVYPYEWNSDDGNFDIKALVWKANKVAFVRTITLNGTDLTLPLSQTPDLIYNSNYTHTHTIDFNEKLIILDSDEYDVQQVYSLWKDEILIGDNARRSLAFSQVGGNPTGGANSIPYYTFLSNDWKIRPQEANGTTNVINGILLTDDQTDPFVDTLGAFTVRINYQQPVQAIAVATGSTPADVWNYTVRRLSEEGVTDIQTGLATEIQADAIKKDTGLIGALL